MTFDPTITMGNTLTAGTIVIALVVAWVRMDSSQNVIQEKLREVAGQHANEVLETRRELNTISQRYEQEVQLNALHRQQVSESLHQTALLNQATLLTLNSIVKDVNRIDREVEKLRERKED